MIRFLLYALLIWFVWKLVAVVFAPRRRDAPPAAPRPKGEDRPDFRNIKDAEFEELPPSPDEPKAPPAP